MLFMEPTTARGFPLTGTTSEGVHSSGGDAASSAKPRRNRKSRTKESNRLEDRRGSRKVKSVARFVTMNQCPPWPPRPLRPISSERTGERGVGLWKSLEGKARNLGDDVINARLVSYAGVSRVMQFQGCNFFVD